MFKTAKAYEDLKVKINEEVKQELLKQINNLVGKELTPTEVDGMLESGELEMKHVHLKTVPGLFGIQYNGGDTVISIHDKVNDKAVAFRVKIDINTKTLDYDLIITEEMVF